MFPIFLWHEKKIREKKISKSIVNFKLPKFDRLSYSIHIIHRYIIPNNIIKWQVFEDDEKIKMVLTSIYKCSNISIYSNEEEDKKN